MSDADNNDDLHEDESDENRNEDEDGRTQEERWEDEDIEEEIADNPLVKIGGKTYDRRTVTDIEVGEGVTEIEKNTFRCSPKLSSINLPSTLTSIGDYGFYLCESLKSIKLPASLITLSRNAFCASSLRSIIIPNSVTTLGWGNFDACKSLTTATLSDSMSSIPRNTFVDCSSLETINLPASVSSLDWGAFENCSALRSVEIPINATVDANAFDGCTKLEAKSASYNMTIVEYFRDYYHERVKLRVSVLTCLKRINEGRMRKVAEAVERMKLNDGSSSSSVGGEMNSGINIQRQPIGEFQGVLAEEMITAEELWREILKFL